MDVEEKDRMGKQKGVIINGKDERGNEKKPEKSQKKKYKTGTKTINLYMGSSSFLLPSSFFRRTSDGHRTDIRYIRYIRRANPLPNFLQLIAGNTFGSGGQLHCTGDSNGNSFIKN